MSQLPSHRTQAARQFVEAADHLGSASAASGRPQRGPRRARQAVHLRALGRCGAPAWVNATARATGSVSGWPTARRSSRSATPRAKSGSRSSRATCRANCGWDVGRVVALRAAPSGRRVANRQPSQRGARRRSRRRHAAASSIAATAVAATTSPGRPTAPGSRTPSATSPRHSAIKLYDVASGAAALVTQPEFRDYSPSFDPDGRYLYFLSLRTFDPVYDSVQFELSASRARRGRT